MHLRRTIARAWLCFTLVLLIGGSAAYHAVGQTNTFPSTGNAGVGTTSPSNPLVVVGGANSYSSVVQNPAAAGSSFGLIVDAGGNSSDYSVRIRQRTGGAELFAIRGDGNVGIGTTGPLAKFHVEGLAGSYAGYFHGVTTTSQSLGLLIDAGTNASDYGLRVRSYGSTDFFAVRGDGNVGIGTSSPGVKLAIQQDSTTSQQLALQNDTLTAGRYSEILFRHSNGAGASGIRGYAVNLNSNNESQLRFFTSPSGNSPTERMIIDQAGNVGIGTTSPDSPLHVGNGPAMSGGWNRTINLHATYPVAVFNSAASRWAGIGYDYSTSMRFWVNATSNDVPGTGLNAMTILNGGAVGIGTGSPAQRFSVLMPGEGTIAGFGANSAQDLFTIGYSSGASILKSSVYGRLLLTTQNNHNIDLTPNGTGNVILEANNAGNVGIGLTDPGSYKLNVNGEINATGLRINGTPIANSASQWTNGTGSISYTSGKVGIGTAEPMAKLDVAGAIKANNHLTLLPWYNLGTPSAGAGAHGYMKLVTPIVHTEENMFSIKIKGYRYGTGGTPVEIRCGGYAYASGSLISAKCDTEGTEDAVGIGVEGSNVIVTIGSQSGGAWYYDHFTAEYSGWKPKDPDAFTWQFVANADPTTTNTNNVIVNDSAGTITTTGNVGIGTTTPSNPLVVVGGANNYSSVIQNSAAAGTSFGLLVDAGGNSSDYSVRIRQRTGGAELFAIRGDGNVGIGTMSPGEKLSVQGAVGLRSSANATRMTIVGDESENLISTSGVPLGVYISGANYFKVNTNGVNRMLITGDGKVGIGRDPAYPLDVNGEINATGLRINGTPISTVSSQWTNGTGSISYNDGKVGIGMVDPMARLDVAGAIKANNHLTLLPWYNLGSASAGPWAHGYMKLVTPIVHNEENMFSIKIKGYRYGTGGTPVEIRCGGYAWGAGSLMSTKCDTEGTDDWVGIGLEGNNVIVTIGSQSGGTWYFDHFTAEYSGEKPKDPDAFSWQFVANADPSTTNTNNVIVNDSAGTITTTGNVAIGTPTLAARLEVNGIIRNSAANGFSIGPDSSQNRVQTSGTTFQFLTSGNAAATTQVGALAITSNYANTPPGNGLWVEGNVGIGPSTSGSTYKLDVNGNTNVTGNINLTGTINAKYQDVAEWVPSSEQLAAGTVVVLDSTKSNQVISSSVSYDTRVAGVVSEQPGIALGEKGACKVLVATTGRVKVKVDASKGPIHIGDLLVTSDVPGVAMKSEPVEFAGRKMHMPGTLIGKALEPLARGKGEILVLLSLQ